jgi:hypothetical protein
MAVVYLDVCPKCRVDVSRRFGLIRTPIIPCPRCGYEMRVTADAVRNNWQFNFIMAAGLFFWLFLACVILLDPKGATQAVARYGHAKGADNPWILAGLSFIPAFFLAMPFALIGRVIGSGVGKRMLTEFSQDSSASASPSSLRPYGSAPGRQELQTNRWLAATPAAPAAPAEPSAPTHRAQPRGGGIGSFFLRFLAGVLWWVAFFIAGSFAITFIVMAMNGGDQEARQQAVELAGRTSSVPLFFGSLFLVGVLAKLGWLPGVRRREPEPAPSDNVLPRTGSSDSRLIVGR